ncbi:MAG: DUF2442 domain-containing protein [Methylobacter sp.]|jgi:hypothetical protein|nr:DUF2442 domain-containing protein [Methylobacter sp.]
MSKVVTVSPLPHQHLFVEMADGECGEFDMTPYLESEFFSALKDDAYFKQVTVFFRGVGWPDGQDIGPDTIAAGLVKSKNAQHQK